MLDVARTRADVVLQLVLLLLRSFMGATGEGEAAPLLRDIRDFLTQEDDAIAHVETLI
jgi:hypothetical protein